MIVPGSQSSENMAIIFGIRALPSSALPPVQISAFCTWSFSTLRAAYYWHGHLGGAESARDKWLLPVLPILRHVKLIPSPYGYFIYKMVSAFEANSYDIFMKIRKWVRKTIVFSNGSIKGVYSSFSGGVS